MIQIGQKFSSSSHEHICIIILPYKLIFNKITKNNAKITKSMLLLWNFVICKVF